MITLQHPTPISSLLHLETCDLALRSIEANSFHAFLDFSEVIEAKTSKTKEFLTKLSSNTSENNSIFSGWIGFFGYEFLAHHRNVKLHARKDLDVPDAWFGRPRSSIIFSPDQTKIVSCNSSREKELAKILTREIKPTKSNKSELGESLIKCNLSFSEYEKIFKQAKEAILDGETYQIKISQRFESANRIHPILSFERLMRVNPAPESFLLQTRDFSIFSCSPETVIDLQGQSIKTRPIGGTYQRSNRLEDQSVIERFLQDPKEVAEHNMLVDLERNDLSSLCKPGSVRLENFREVESYSHLHHLVSTISGTLKDEIELSDILRGILPGGSITGCPKVRTMEWIDRLEPCFRGPYTGSFGTVMDNGNLHFNLIIRAMLVLEERCYTQAGGGIVIDSTPAYEFNENKIKAQALLDLMT